MRADSVLDSDHGDSDTEDVKAQLGQLINSQTDSDCEVNIDN